MRKNKRVTLEESSFFENKKDTPKKWKKLLAYIIFLFLFGLIFGGYYFFCQSDYAIYRSAVKDYMANDYESAASKFRILAKRKHYKSMYYLGLCYYEGNGVPKDEDEAVTLIAAAAKKDIVDAVKFINTFEKVNAVYDDLSLLFSIISSDTEEIDAFNNLEMIMELRDRLSENEVDADFIKTVNEFFYISALDHNNIEEIKYYLENIPEDACKVLGYKLTKKCSRCNSGVLKCRHCKDTKVCPYCNGKGYVESRKFVRRYFYYGRESLPVSRIVEEKEQTECSPQCRECLVPRTCYTCRGFGVLIYKKRVEEFLKMYRKKLHNAIQHELQLREKMATAYKELQKE